MGVISYILTFVCGSIFGIVIMCLACAADSDGEEDE